MARFIGVKSRHDMAHEMSAYHAPRRICQPTSTLLAGMTWGRISAPSLALMARHNRHRVWSALHSQPTDVPDLGRAEQRLPQRRVTQAGSQPINDLYGSTVRLAGVGGPSLGLPEVAQGHIGLPEL